MPLANWLHKKPEHQRHNCHRIIKIIFHIGITLTTSDSFQRLLCEINVPAPHLSATPFHILILGTGF